MSPRDQRNYLRERGWRCASVFGDLWVDPKSGGMLSLRQAFELQTRLEAVPSPSTPTETK